MDGLESVLSHLSQLDTDCKNVEINGSVWTSECLPVALCSRLEDFVKIKQLDISGVGLKSLDNFPKLPTLETLLLSNNKIEGDLTSLNKSKLPRLRCMNLSGNLIRKISDLQPLIGLPLLHNLNLKGCIVTNTPDYIITVFDMFSSLKILDSWQSDGRHIQHLEETNGKTNGTKNGTQIPSSFLRTTKKRPPPPQHGKLYALAAFQDIRPLTNGAHMRDLPRSVEHSSEEPGDVTDAEPMGPSLPNDDVISAGFLEPRSDEAINNMGRDTDDEISSSEVFGPAQEAANPENAEDTDSEEDGDYQPGNVSEEEPNIEGNHTDSTDEDLDEEATQTIEDEATESEAKRPRLNLEQTPRTTRRRAGS